MKYGSTTPPLQCFMRQSTWYQSAGTMTPLGVLWHSTGANNPNLRRYIQPDDNAQDRIAWMKLLGENAYQNDWNHVAVQAGVNAWIGKLADGTVTTVQVAPWSKMPWGCGSGKNGSCNNGWIQFEICEDSLSSEAYFNAVYREACELTAYLCQVFNLNPKGTVKLNGVTVPVILCHHDSYKLGLGTGHIDVDHWFERYGKTMDDVRNDVAVLLSGSGFTLKEDDLDMTKEELMSVAGTGDNPSTWAKPHTEWAKAQGIFNGDGQGNFGWQQPISRESLAVILHQMSDTISREVTKNVIAALKEALMNASK